jgi:Family of unknown function (DUF5719)
VTRLLRRRSWFAVLVAVALGLVYAAASQLGHQAAAAAPVGKTGRAAVESATFGCPAPGSTGATSGGLAILANPGNAPQGSAVVTRVDGSSAGKPIRTVNKDGLQNVAKVTSAPAVKGNQKQQAGAAGVPTTVVRGGVLVQATGSMAQGLEVEQTGQSGLVTAPCTEPGTDFWFVGPGVSSAANIELYLMNPSGQPADAQVTALTDAGPVLGSPDTGIVVPPHTELVQSLAGYLKSSRVVSLHISATIGQLVANVRESKRNSQAGEWLPPAQPPATHVVIPGIPAAAGSRVLYVAVPGSDNAQVKVTAVTSKGSYQPTGGSNIDLPSNSAAQVQLPSLAGLAGAVEVSANVPVTATMMVSGGAAGAPGAIAGSAAPVQEQGVIADCPHSAAGTAEVVLSAPGKAATVRIVTGTSSLTVAGQAGQLVTVPAGHTIVQALRQPKGSRDRTFSVLITPQPGSGQVYAGRVIKSAGSVVSIMAVPSSLTWVPLVRARDSLLTVLP